MSRKSKRRHKRTKVRFRSRGGGTILEFIRKVPKLIIDQNPGYYDKNFAKMVNASRIKFVDEINDLEIKHTKKLTNAEQARGFTRFTDVQARQERETIEKEFWNEFDKIAAKYSQFIKVTHGGGRRRQTKKSKRRHKRTKHKRT